MADDEPMPIDTPEHRARLAVRRGHPTGAHIRERPHPDELNSQVEPPLVDIGSLTLQVEALTDMMQKVTGRLDTGTNAPKPDAWKWVAGLGGVVSVIIALFGAAHTVVTSNQESAASTQKLTDVVENLGSRLKLVEDRQATNVPVLQQQVMENRNQADTINALREGIADERRARQVDIEQNRKAFSDIMALVGRYSDKLADLDKAVAVMQAPGRRSEASPPVRDAQVMQGR